MSKKRFIDSVSIKSPCNESWDEMVGNDAVRFCSHCSKHVTNLSEMTAFDAAKFVRQSKGNICIRLVKRGDTTAFRPEYSKSRRSLPVMAAGILAASLALPLQSTGQSVSPSGYDESSVEQELLKKKPIEDLLISLTGRIYTEAPLPVVKSSETDEAEPEEDMEEDLDWMSDRIILINKETGDEYESNIDDDRYTFTDIPVGTYELRFAGGFLFKKKIIIDVPIVEGYTTVQDIKLDRLKNVEGTFEYGYGMGGAMAMPRYENPLVSAVNFEEVDDVKRLLASGADPNVQEKNYGNLTPLFFAVEGNNVEIAELLLRFGARPNFVVEGDTPISRISSSTEPEIIRLLIKHGADLNRADSDGKLPLFEMARVGKTEVFKIVYEHVSDNSIRDEFGQNVLLLAALNDNLDVVKFLLENKLDANAVNIDGETAIELTGSKKIEELLIAHGAKPLEFEYATPSFTILTENDLKSASSKDQ